MEKTILIAGCGNIGLRHLQALLRAKPPLRIIVVEPNDATREKAAAALGDIPPQITVDFRSAWTDMPETVDLAIIATPAQPRRKVLETVLGITRPRYLMLEKIVFVTQRDFDAVQAQLAELGIPAVVNCGRRGFAGYDRLREALAGRQGISMQVSGSNWGMGSNTVHFLDLASNLLGELPSALSTDKLSAPEPARHPGCVEFTGTLEGTLPSGGKLTITSLTEAGQPITITLIHGDERWLVEEGANRITHYAADGATTEQELGTRFVSQMEYLYDEILHESRSRLPSLALSAQQHRLVLDAFRAHLNLSITEDAPCPIS